MSKKYNILPSAEDGIIWVARTIFNEKGSIGQRAESLRNIAALVGLIQDQFTRDSYVDELSKRLGVKPKDLRNYLPKIAGRAPSSSQGADDDEDDDNRDIISTIVSQWKLDKDQEYTLRNFLYWAVTDKSKPSRVGYYFVSGKDWAVKQLSNFFIVPLYHIKVKKNERRIIAIENAYESKLIEVDSHTISSSDAFRKEVNRFGAFWWKAPTENLISVLQSFGHEAFPSCYELSALGWHPRGFFAFANAAFNGQQLESYNEFGMYQHGNQHYNVPFLSPIDRDYEQDDNSFEFEHYLQYKKSPITFIQWVDLMCKAYLHMGPVAVNFVLATLFRDIVLQSTKLPLLYNYGAVGAGKSDFTDSITNIFFSGLDSQGGHYKPFNLNQGTDFAFFTRMERFRNLPNALNEFDENKIPENWYRAVKGAFDGEGREKGDMERKGKTKVQRINCSVILSGQFLGTKDENSVVSRSLLNHFPAQIHARPESQVKAYQKLKKYELEGISSIICDLLVHRPIVLDEYPVQFDVAQNWLEQHTLSHGVDAPTRMIKNWASILTMHYIFKNIYKLPYDSFRFESYCGEMVRHSTIIQGSTNTLSGFWNIFQYLVETGKLISGYHYQLVQETGVKVEEKSEPITWSSPRKIMYLRTSAIFPYYQEAAAKQRTETLSKPNLDNYLRETDYYIGSIRNRRFQGRNETGALDPKVTSCIVIDFSNEKFEAMGISIGITLDGQGAALPI